MLLLTTYSFANWPDLRQRDTARQAELRPRLEKIQQDHPRIFCRTEDFVEIRQRIKATPEIKEVAHMGFKVKPFLRKHVPT
jgi:hypothetical protein